QHALRPFPKDRYADAVEMESALSWELGQGGVTRARTQLAFRIQELFEEERREESSRPPEPTGELYTGQLPVEEESWEDRTGTKTRVAVDSHVTYTVVSA